MQASAVELLEVLLEETSKSSRNLAHGISQELDMSKIQNLMDHFWKLQEKWDEENKYQLRARHAISRAFHVICKMADYLGVEWTKLTGSPNTCI